MSPEERRAAATWVNDLAGYRCPWSLRTAHDLREWARNVADDRDNLTGSELKRLQELILHLGPPAERRRAEALERKAAIEAKRWSSMSHEELLAGLDMGSPLRKAPPFRAVAANRQRGDHTRALVNEILRCLEGKPEKERAALIAQHSTRSVRHIRRLLKEKRQEEIK